MLLQLASDTFRWSDIDWLISKMAAKLTQADDLMLDRQYVGMGCVYLIIQSIETGKFDCRAATFKDIADEFAVEIAECLDIERRDEYDHLKHVLEMNAVQYPCYKLDCFFTDPAQYVEERTRLNEAAVQREVKHLGALIRKLNGHPD